MGTGDPGAVPWWTSGGRGTSEQVAYLPTRVRAGHPDTPRPHVEKVM